MVACKLISDPPIRVVEPPKYALEPIPLVNTNEFRSFLRKNGFTRKNGGPIEINFAWPNDSNTPRTNLNDSDKRTVGEMVLRGIKHFSNVFAVVPNPTDLLVRIVPSGTGVYGFQAGFDDSPNPVGMITMEKDAKLDAWAHETTHAGLGINETRFGESAAILAARLANGGNPIYAGDKNIESEIAKVEKQITKSGNPIILPRGPLLYYELEEVIWQIYQDKSTFPNELARGLKDSWGAARIRPDPNVVANVFANAAGFDNVGKLSERYPIYCPRVSIQSASHG